MEAVIESKVAQEGDSCIRFFHKIATCGRSFNSLIRVVICDDSK